MSMFTYKKYLYLLVPVWVLMFSMAYAVPAWGQTCAGDVPIPRQWSPAGPPLTQATVGQFYSTQITVSCFNPVLCGSFSNYTFVDGFFPTGLNLSPGGIISGTPTQAGPYNFTIRVNEACLPAGQTLTHNYSINVVAPVITVTGSVSPSSYSAPSNITTTQSLAYTFTTTPFASTTMVSAQGTFQVGGTQIGANYRQISAKITGGRGTVFETITILPSVMQKALSMGYSKMTYNRSFTNGTNTVNTQVEITITTAAAADLMITRMQLYFQNRQPVITIKRNDSSLRTYAEINYVGSGLLQGYWEVDGNFLSNVNQTITYGTAIRIESPAPPILPTFTSGTHRIRLVITKPSQNIPFPEIRYYVTSEEPRLVEAKKLTPLSLLFPHNKGVIGYAPVTFLWATRETGVAAYFLAFYLKDEEKLLFSAYTKNPSYSLPETILKTFFSPGKTYAWQVKGFDTFNNVAAESTLFTFTMGE